ncbi:MAG: radical SAM protein [Fretibacterium sp.]|nr:radical SAM protein [Fretibacterium sp.]
MPMEIIAQWQRPEGRSVRCSLCFRGCLLAPGETGFCGARMVPELPEGATARLVSPWLGGFVSQAVDPIEKKPLYHWRPGSLIYSLGSVGCTMACPFCQNHSISRPEPARLPRLLDRGLKIPPEELAPRTRGLGLSAVALTYNEPTLQAEYILKAAPLLRQQGIALVLVTNGMVSPAPAEALAPWVDAANIDLKTFNTEAYARLGGSLDTVKSTITTWVRAGVHVEVTCLVVPGISDSIGELEAMTDWLASLSPDLPLHLSRYFPSFHYNAPPTDRRLLDRMAETAQRRLRHVHLGNV